MNEATEESFYYLSGRIRKVVEEWLDPSRFRSRLPGGRLTSRDLNDGFKDKVDQFLKVIFHLWFLLYSSFRLHLYSALVQ